MLFTHNPILKHFYWFIEDDFQQSIALVETNDLGCPEDGPNIFPIPSSCPEYYLCINETAYRAQCPGDLLMNSDKMTCDFPDDTSCGKYKFVNFIINNYNNAQ